jgi:hypothetical protein
MTKTRLAVTLSLALLVVPFCQAAKYRVVELPLVAEGQSSFPSAINEDGNITVNVSFPYNIPIDLDLLDFESEVLINLLTDIDSARNGDFNSVDYEILLALIRSADGQENAQQIANTISFLASENEINYIPGFDQLSEINNEFNFNTTNNVRDLNNSGFAVGSGEGFYKKIDYTFENEENEIFVVHEFGTRGFISLGNTVVGLPAPMAVAGGFSEAFKINENNQVVGYGTTLSLSDEPETSVINCENEEIIDDGDPETKDFPLRGDIPVEACLNKVVNAFTTSITNPTATNIAQLRGLIWQLDQQGNLLDTKVLGILFEPEIDDITNYSSQALDINDNGIAVGVSNGQYTENSVTVTRNFAVIFDGDEVINLTPDPDSNAARTSNSISSATGINNNNLVVGHKVKSVNGTNRTKFFVYDMNLDELTFPNDFFLGSSSIATDINNNGLVVGYGEVDSSLSGRRSEGFLYNHDNGEFYGVRDLIRCDSPYTIVQANSINDKDEIVATALYQGPLRDSKGEIILDSTGNETIVDLVIAVKLEPILVGEVEDCDAPADEINRDRQGAALTYMLFFGCMIIGWRRFKF